MSLQPPPWRLQPLLAYLLCLQRSKANTKVPMLCAHELQIPESTCGAPRRRHSETAGPRRAPARALLAAAWCVSLLAPCHAIAAAKAPEYLVVRDEKNLCTVLRSHDLKTMQTLLRAPRPCAKTYLAWQRRPTALLLAFGKEIKQVALPSGKISSLPAAPLEIEGMGTVEETVHILTAKQPHWRDVQGVALAAGDADLNETRLDASTHTFVLGAEVAPELRSQLDATNPLETTHVLLQAWALKKKNWGVVDSILVNNETDAGFNWHALQTATKLNRQPLAEQQCAPCSTVSPEVSQAIATACDPNVLRPLVRNFGATQCLAGRYTRLACDSQAPRAGVCACRWTYHDGRQFDENVSPTFALTSEGLVHPLPDPLASEARGADVRFSCRNDDLIVRREALAAEEGDESGLTQKPRFLSFVLLAGTFVPFLDAQIFFMP